MSDKVQTIHKHEGRKYLRTIKSTDPCSGQKPIDIDVYCVINAYRVTCPARVQAIKKILCAGDRNKGTTVDDLVGAIAALNRAIEMELQDNPPPPEPNEP